MKYDNNIKNTVFAAIAGVIVLVVVGFLLFGNDILPVLANSISSITDKPTAKEVAEEYIVDGKFTEEDISEWSPLGDHRDYLPVEQYAGYCKDLQTSGRYSTNVYTNSFLSMKRYIAPEEVPVYDEFLKDAPTSTDPRTIVMDTIAKNWREHPELNSYGDMIMKIAAACK